MSELKPCAHCGGKPEIIAEYEDIGPHADKQWLVQCQNCLMTMVPRLTRDAAINVWNRRADQAATQQAQGERKVGCERDDGLLIIHGESETCDVCKTFAQSEQEGEQ